LWLGTVVEQVGGDPLDVHAACVLELSGLLDPDGGEVDARYLPAALGEPHGVAPFAAREVEGARGCQ
jgi:hypothetical protein